MRLIDADALRRKLVWGKVRLGTVYEASVRVVTVDALKSAPTVNAKPVVHGKWVDRYGMKYANHLYECSVCKNPALYMPITDSLGSDHIYQATTLFCPYCGARMDLEE